MWVIAAVCLALSCVSAYAALIGVVKGRGPSGIPLFPPFLATVLLALHCFIEGVWRHHRVDLSPYVMLWFFIALFDVVAWLLLPWFVAWLLGRRR